MVKDRFGYFINTYQDEQRILRKAQYSQPFDLAGVIFIGESAPESQSEVGAQNRVPISSTGLVNNYVQDAGKIPVIIFQINCLGVWPHVESGFSDR